MSSERVYEGQELELFAGAVRWKSYWAGKVRPYVTGSVLEVGAGLGANTPYLYGPSCDQWLCLEPDLSLLAQIPATLAAQPWRARVKTQGGTLADLSDRELFDTILYIDVLEHIEGDHAEMRAALAHLRPGGKIIVLSPAQPWLYTEFDRAIGHYRRHTRATLRACAPEGSRLVDFFALDSCGLLASVANKLFLHQNMPSLKQIGFWDRCLVPVSRWTDPLIGHAIGKSLVAVWQKV
jgi:SAM-dependent methyltransferase